MSMKQLQHFFLVAANIVSSFKDSLGLSVDYYTIVHLIIGFVFNLVLYLIAVSYVRQQKWT